jgi:hypothetical protein
MIGVTKRTQSCYPPHRRQPMGSDLYYFADGTTAQVLHTITYGEIIIGFLLLAILFIELYRLWREH